DARVPYHPEQLRPAGREAPRPLPLVGRLPQQAAAVRHLQPAFVAVGLEAAQLQALPRGQNGPPPPGAALEEHPGLLTGSGLAEALPLGDGEEVSDLLDAPLQLPVAPEALAAPDQRHAVGL